MPEGALSGEVQQAYKRRTSSAPGEGYSEDALASRQQVLEAAASLLCAPSARYAYDRELAAGRGQCEAELPPHLVAGVFVSLEETGDAECVLRAGHDALQRSTMSPETRADVLLAMALSECSLARRELEAGRIPKGCERLESALGLLESERDFHGAPIAPALLDEIDRSLELLAPACALAHLGLPLDEENAKTRANAAHTLAQLLKVPRTGPSVDASRLPALNVKYVRSAFGRLTPEEAAGLVDWWRVADVMLGRGSVLPGSQAEAIRLGATAMMAVGFYMHNPQLVADADVALADVAEVAGAHVEIERCVAALLLGQPAEALRWANDALIAAVEGRAGAALSATSERSLRLVAEAAESGGVDAALPGLCALVERWLAEAALAPFRVPDASYALENGSVAATAAADGASLMLFFDDPVVTRFAEACEYPPQRRSYGFGGALVGAWKSVGGFFGGLFGGNGGMDAATPQAPAQKDTRTRGAATELEATSAVGAAPGEARASPGRGVFDTTGIRGVDSTDGARGSTESGWADPEVMKATAEAEQVAKARAGEVGGGSGLRDSIPAPPLPSSIPASERQANGALRSKRLPLRVRQSIGVACIVAAAAVARTAMRMDSDAGDGGVPTMSARATGAAPARGPQLDRRAAEQAIRRWQDAKRNALGPKRATGGLGDVLAEPALTQWRGRASDAATNGYHWEYKLRSLRLMDGPKSTAGGGWTVDVSLDEGAKLVCKEDPSINGSYNNVYTARYEIVRDLKSHSWKVKSTTVVQSQ